MSSTRLSFIAGDGTLPTKVATITRAGFNHLFADWLTVPPQVCGTGTLVEVGGGVGEGSREGGGKEDEEEERERE